MPLDLNTWNAVVKRKWMTSGAFKELDTAVKAYLANKTLAQNLANLRGKWTAWILKLKKEGKTYSTSDRYVRGGALDDLALLCEPPRIGAPQLTALVEARENRVVAKRTANLVFQMTGGTDMNVNDPLRYNLRKTGLGRQDAEVLVTLPILVHQGADSKAYWITKGYSPASFDVTAHGHKPGVLGATASEEVLKRWTKTINDWWGKAAVIHHPPSGANSFYRLKFEFSFTDDPTKACKQVCCVRTTGQAHTVNPTGTIDAVRWGVDDTGPGGPICHEVGHFLGCPDEYFTITYEGRTKAWGDGYTIDGVMNNPDTKPLARHYRKMGQELAYQFGFDPNQASIILDVALGLDNPAQKRHRLAGHIWDGA
jgi:hypothetical protein